MKPTKIAWTDFSSNPIVARDPVTNRRGWFCQKVSPGCKFCYAELVNIRFGNGKDFEAGNSKKVTIEINSAELIKVYKHQNPEKVFVCDMTDLFYHGIPGGWIDMVFATMWMAKQHTFQVLTKRAEAMETYLTTPGRYGEINMAGYGVFGRKYVPIPEGMIDNGIPNIWLGVTGENQEYAAKRMEVLARLKTPVKFMSYEPALGEIDLDALPHIDWLLVGGESGVQGRPFDVEWARKAIEQGKRLGTKVFVKQLGSVWARANNSQSWKADDPDEWPEDLRVMEMPDGV